MTNKIAFITEAGPEIGYGHLFRSLALAKELIKRGEVTEFVIENKNAEQIIINQLGEVGITSLKYLEKNISKFKYVFIDVYNNSWNNYKELINKAIDTKFVSIIDYAFMDYAIETDFIFAIGLQPYNFKEEILWTEGVNTKIFSGNDFFIFRDEFSKNNLPEIKKEVQNVLISMGGSDPLDLTVQVLKSLDKLDKNLNLEIVLGAGYNEDRNTGLKNLITNSKHTVTLHKNVSNIASLMLDCELAIINGGNTRFELAYLGIPFISISINQKQKEISDYAEVQWVGVSLGVYNEISNAKLAETFNVLSQNFEKRKAMSSKMKEIINVNGTNKIYEILF